MAQAAAAAMIAGTILQVAGIQQEGKVAAAQAQHRAKQLQVQQQVLQQDIQQEGEAEELRQRLIATEGGRETGILAVQLIGQGQSIEPGESAFDLTQDSRDETRFKAALSSHESDLRKRNLAIEADTIEGNIGAARAEALAARSAANISSLTALTSGASTGFSKFQFGSIEADTEGNLQFRTKT